VPHPYTSHLFLPLPVPPNRLQSLPIAACAFLPPPTITSHRCLCLATISHLILPLPVPPHFLLSLPSPAVASPPPPNSSYRFLCLSTASHLFPPLTMPPNRLPSLPSPAVASQSSPITSYHYQCLPTASQLIMLLHRADNHRLGLTAHENFDCIFCLRLRISELIIKPFFIGTKLVQTDIRPIFIPA